MDTGAVGRETQEGNAASGILVSLQAHGPRKKFPPYLEMVGSKPVARAIEGALYIHSRRYDTIGLSADDRRGAPKRYVEHIGGTG